MIRGYSDHAANERTFLAWVRTAIAVIAFGFVIEKFNLFVLTVANANSLDAERRLQLERLSGPLGRYDGLTLIVFGLVLVMIAAARLSAPSGCSMTRKLIRPAAAAQRWCCPRHWRCL
jgi:putative membrane protein